MTQADFGAEEKRVPVMRRLREQGFALLAAALVLAAPVAACELEGESSASIAEIAAAAERFIETLSKAQRASASYELESTERRNWSNLPVILFSKPRPGVKLGDLNDEQVRSAFEFLNVALSSCGVQRVKGVLGAENELSKLFRAKFLGWSVENYWLAFYGTPSEVHPWAWGFGGHHLAINATIASGRVYLSPTFLGIEPAVYQDSEGSVTAPLNTIPERATALHIGLDAKRKEDSRVEDRPEEVHAGAGKDGYIPPLEGSRVSTWEDAERERLFGLIGEWVNMMPSAFARIRMDEIRAGVDDLYFGWHEETGGEGDIYFRIQSASDDLLIEFSTLGGVGTSGDEGHYHSIYRDPSNEYGSSVSR